MSDERRYALAEAHRLMKFPSDLQQALIRAGDHRSDLTERERWRVLLEVTDWIRLQCERVEGHMFKGGHDRRV